MKQFIMRRLVAAFLVALCTRSTVAADSHAFADAFSSFIASKRVVLADHIRSSGYVGDDQEGAPRRDLLTALASGTKAEASAGLLSLVVGSTLHNKPEGTRIREPLVVACLVTALRAESPETRKLALRFITVHVPPSSLTDHLEELIQSWELVREYDLLRIIAAADHARGRIFVNKLVEKGYEVPIEIRARTGDQLAERDLVAHFLRETDVAVKGELAYKPGFAASSNALIAIVPEIRSPEVVEKTYYAYSLRYKILMGLREAYPDEPLFNEDLSEVVRRTRNCGDTTTAESQSEGYFDRVEKWCETKFGVRWKQARPPFLLWQQRQRPVFLDK
jgi:hypothetical protein